MKDKNAPIPKKIAITALNVPAVPVAFASDVVLGEFSKSLIKTNHRMVHNKNIHHKRKVALVCLSIIGIPCTIIVDLFYHYFIQLPLLASAAMNHFGGGTSDLKDTHKILSSIQNNTYRTRRFSKLENKINANKDGQLLNRPQIAAILAEATKPDSPAFNEYLKNYKDVWHHRKDHGSAKDGTTRYSPDDITALGVPIGLKEIAAFTRIAQKYSPWKNNRLND